MNVLIGETYEGIMIYLAYINLQICDVYTNGMSLLSLEPLQIWTHY